MTAVLVWLAFFVGGMGLSFLLDDGGDGFA